MILCRTWTRHCMFIHLQVAIADSLVFLIIHTEAPILIHFWCCVLILRLWSECLSGIACCFKLLPLAQANAFVVCFTSTWKNSSKCKKNCNWSLNHHRPWLTSRNTNFLQDRFQYFLNNRTFSSGSAKFLTMVLKMWLLPINCRDHSQKLRLHQNFTWALFTELCWVFLRHRSLISYGIVAHPRLSDTCICDT